MCCYLCTEYISTCTSTSTTCMNLLRLLLFCCIGLVAACDRPTAERTAERPATYDALTARGGSVDDRPKNIILMIGDGMGITQISAGMYSNGNKLQLER